MGSAPKLAATAGLAKSSQRRSEVSRGLVKEENYVSTGYRVFKLYTTSVLVLQTHESREGEGSNSPSSCMKPHSSCISGSLLSNFLAQNQRSYEYADKRNGLFRQISRV
jgi:hypothetical protein